MATIGRDSGGRHSADVGYMLALLVGLTISLRYFDRVPVSHMGGER